MPSYYLSKAYKIIREDGSYELLKSIMKFTIWHFQPRGYLHFRFQTFKNNLLNNVKYVAPPDPYKTIDIHPSEIEFRVARNRTTNENNRPLKKTNQGGIARTKGGDWDKPRHRMNVEDVPIINGMIQRYEKEMEWEETDYYQHIRYKYQRSSKHKKLGFDDLQTYVKKLCGQCDRLYEDIVINGYETGHKGVHVSPGVTQPVRDQLEVLVVIDRNGQINFFEGNHRFGIARVLDLEIPAQVVCRHKQWQKFRDEIYNNGLSEEHDEDLRKHPDLQDIIN